MTKMQKKQAILHPCASSVNCQEDREREAKLSQHEV